MSVNKIVEIMKGAGFELYYVGGYARDIKLGRKPKDIDFATDATPDELLKIADDTGIKARHVGKSFGVVIFHVDGVDYEMATYRVDGNYSDKRRPDTVKFTNCISEDLSRRDFTVNALAICAYTGNIVDLFGGIVDMIRCVVRTVGKPADRFNEDYLRILRFFRFVADLEFEPDEAALAEITSNPARVGEIAVERVREELLKILKSSNPKIAFELMHKTGVLQEILPEFGLLKMVPQDMPHFDDAWTHTMKVLEYTKILGGDEISLVAALLHDIGKVETIHFNNDTISFFGHAKASMNIGESILERLKFPKRDISTILNLLNNHMSIHQFDDRPIGNLRKYFRRAVVNFGEEYVERLLLLSNADRLDMFIGTIDLERIQLLEKVIEELNVQSVKLAISGHDIMDTLDIFGPKVGKVKTFLEDAVVDEKIPNNREFLMNILFLLKELEGK